MTILRAPPTPSRLDIPKGAKCYLCSASNNNGGELRADGYFVCLGHRVGVGPFLTEQRITLQQERDALRGVLENQASGHDCVYRLDLQTRSTELERATTTIGDLRDGITRVIARIRASFDMAQASDDTDDGLAQLAGYVNQLWTRTPRVEALLAERETTKALREADQATLLQQQNEVVALQTRLAALCSREASLGGELTRERETTAALDGQLRAVRAELVQWKAAFRKN